MSNRRRYFFEYRHQQKSVTSNDYRVGKFIIFDSDTGLNWLINTGSSYSILPESLLHQVGKNRVIDRNTSLHLVSVTGSKIKTYGSVGLNVSFGTRKQCF